MRGNMRETMNYFFKCYILNLNNKRAGIVRIEQESYLILTTVKYERSTANVSVLVSWCWPFLCTVFGLPAGCSSPGGPRPSPRQSQGEGEAAATEKRKGTKRREEKRKKKNEKNENRRRRKKATSDNDLSENSLGANEGSNKTSKKRRRPRRRPPSK